MGWDAVVMLNFDILFGFGLVDHGSHFHEELLNAEFGLFEFFFELPVASLFLCVLFLKFGFHLLFLGLIAIGHLRSASDSSFGNSAFLHFLGVLSSYLLWVCSSFSVFKFGLLLEHFNILQLLL
jgi:hypothetical protein